MAVPGKHSNIVLGTIVLILSLLLAGCSSDEQVNADARIQQAREYLQANKHNEAMIELKSALQVQSDLPEARWILGKIYLDYGFGSPAIKEIEQARSMGFTDPEMDVVLLRAQLLQQKYKETLDQTLEKQDPDAATLVVRGNAYIGLNELDRASASFNQALAKEPSSIEAREGLAHIAMSNKNLEEASRFIEEAQEIDADDVEILILKGQLGFLKNDMATAEASFNRAISLAEFNLVAQFGLARAYLVQQKLDDARKTIKAIENRIPKHPLAKYFRAFIALQENDYDKAKALLLGVLGMLPTHAESLLLLSRIHYDEGQLEQAKEYISTFLASHPNHLPAIKLLSVIRLALQQTDEAITALEDLSGDVELDSQLMVLLGSAHIDNGDIASGMELLKQAALLEPDVAPIHTQLAIGNLKAGNTEVAISELESAIQLDPELVQAEIMLILTYIDNEKLDDALLAAESMNKKNPESPLAVNLIGAVYLEKGDSKTARKYFEQALELDSNFIPALVNIARLELSSATPESAQALYERVLGIDENNVEALIYMAQVESQKRNFEQVETYLKRARETAPGSLRPKILLARYFQETGNYQEMLALASEAHDIAPEDPETLLLLGEAQRLNNRATASIDTLQSLVKLRPDSHSALYQLSLTQFRAGEINLAKKSLMEILDSDPNHVGALLSLSRIHTVEKQFRLAEEYTERVRKIEGAAIDADIMQGDIYIARQQPEEAIGAFKRAYDIRPEGLVVTKLAQAYELTGDTEKALDIAEQWISQNPTDLRVRLYVAGTHQQVGNTQRATQAYENILAEHPDNVVVLNNLAWMYMSSSLKRSEELARKANLLLPNETAVLDTLGWILIKQRKFEEGLNILDTAIEKDPGSADIKYHFAAGLILSGEIKRGGKALQSLLQEHGSFPSRQEAEDLLSTLN